MKVLVDENIPARTVFALRAAGHDVRDVRSTPQRGLPDDELWQLGQAEGRLLITTDKGFCEYRDVRHHGILVVRLRQPNEEQIHARVMTALQRFREDEWPGLLVVMRDMVLSTHRARLA